MSKSTIDNKTNQKRLEALIKKVCGYLSKGDYLVLHLDVPIQDGIIQDMKLTPVKKGDTVVFK